MFSTKPKQNMTNCELCQYFMVCTTHWLAQKYHINAQRSCGVPRQQLGLAQYWSNVGSLILTLSQPVLPILHQSSHFILRTKWVKKSIMILKKSTITKMEWPSDWLTFLSLELLKAVKTTARSLHWHNGDVLMGMMASQITSLTIVYSTVYSGAHQRKHQSFASLAFVQGIHRGPVNSLHKWPVTWKMFPFHHVIMESMNNKPVSMQTFLSSHIYSAAPEQFCPNIRSPRNRPLWIQHSGYWGMLHKGSPNFS